MKMSKQEDKKPQNQTKLFLIVGGVLVLAVVGVFLLFPQQKKTDVSEASSSKVKKSSSVEELETVESSSSSEEQVTNTFEHPQETAKATLETDEGVSDQDTQVVRDALQSAVDYINATSQEELKPDFGAHLQQTDASAMRMMKILESVGYHFQADSVSVVRSKTNGVLQYSFNYSNDEGKVVSFTGNYVVGNGQLQIQNWYGDLSFMAKE
jgi:hypothetical protein